MGATRRGAPFLFLTANFTRSSVPMDQKSTSELYEFGSFRVDPDKRLLLREDQPVPLAPKTFETLLVLIRHHREVVSKDELMKNVWPDTFVEETNLSRNIFLLRKALGEDGNYIVTLPGRGYRFAEQVRVVPQQGSGIVLESHSRSQVVVEHGRANRWPWLVLLLAMAGAMGSYYYFSFHRAAKLTDKDTVVLAEFTNTTGDPVFDGTLRQGLSSQLEQSPFLNLLSDSRIAQTLTLMTQPKDVRLTPELARQVCQRTTSAATIEGSIASLGSQYVLGLKAVNCANGDLLAQEQVTASGKEQVLKALEDAATKMRAKLGESLASVQKFDKPLEAVTTSSLAALQAYSEGVRTLRQKGDTAAIPFIQRTLELDPNFADAYVFLGVAYSNLNQRSLSVENLRKAYERRDRASERERIEIVSLYYDLVTGELQKAVQQRQLSVQEFPQDALAHHNLGAVYHRWGQYENAVTETRAALRLDPTWGLSYANLAFDYLALNRLEEAQAVIDEALSRKLDNRNIHWVLYDLAFLRDDQSAMRRQLVWAAARPEGNGSLLAREAGTQAYQGRLRRARQLTRQAVAVHIGLGFKESAALHQVRQAACEAEFGNAAEARNLTRKAIALAPGREVWAVSAATLARIGDFDDARRVADVLNREFPLDTLVQDYWLPTIRAQIEIGRNHPGKAIEDLQAAEPYELGRIGGSGQMFPVYVRGQAYLAAGNGPAAATEFQKLIDHRGLIVFRITGALSHLGLARAYVLIGDTPKAKAAYQDFLTLWKDADPDIPILRQAKTEYAKLR
jgi:eukaryotic-like serine/threonine-protein kinase